MDKKVYLETLGCSKNRVDSEIMLGSLNNQGYQFTDDAEEAEVIIVNTCGFLSAASQESITRILELSDLKQEGRCEKLVAAGCVTQRYGSELAQKIPEIDGLLGSSGFEQIPELLDQLITLRVSSSNSFKKNRITVNTSNRNAFKVRLHTMPI